MKKINILKTTNILFLLASFSFSSVIFATSDAHDLEMGIQSEEKRPLLEGVEDKAQSTCKAFVRRQFRRILSMNSLPKRAINACIALPI